MQELSAYMEHPCTPLEHPKTLLEYSNTPLEYPNFAQEYLNMALEDPNFAQEYPNIALEYPNTPLERLCTPLGRLNGFMNWRPWGISNGCGRGNARGIVTGAEEIFRRLVCGARVSGRSECLGNEHDGDALADRVDARSVQGDEGRFERFRDVAGAGFEGARFEAALEPFDEIGGCEREALACFRAAQHLVQWVHCFTARSCSTNCVQASSHAASAASPAVLVAATTAKLRAGAIRIVAKFMVLDPL